MQENYILRKINYRVSIVVAYAKALEIIQTKMIKDIEIINN